MVTTYMGRRHIALDRRVRVLVRASLRSGLVALRLARSVLGTAGLLGCDAATTETVFREAASQRPYRVVTRRDHDKTRKSAVLFALHAYSTPPDILPTAFSLADRASAERGMILVIPEGTKDDEGKLFWNATLGCCGNSERPPDDLAYLRAVLREVKRTYAVDPERVYAVGVSNGGFMAHRWACAPGGDLRGIAALAGVGPAPEDGACAPSVPVRVLQVHGDADDVIRFEGGKARRGTYPSARATVDRWSALNACDPKPSQTRSWSVLHGFTTRTHFSGSPADVLLWRFEGEGHELRSAQYAANELLDFLEGK
jgi:polyhydroxybutyrate depolymerase